MSHKLAIEGLTQFELHYLSLRKKEGRIYSDQEVANLPFVANHHPLKKEWKTRKFSCDQLVQYLTKLSKPLNILEVGCGNGWLSHQLSEISDVHMVGVDVNSVELQQAKRVFPKSNLEFRSIDIREPEFSEQFDIVVFAASIQYFPSLINILTLVFEKIRAREVHILDTHFYDENDRHLAAERSRQYFANTGDLEMSRFYFHHSKEDLRQFNCQVLFDANSWKNKIFKRSPFSWIRILNKC